MRNITDGPVLDLAFRDPVIRIRRRALIFRRGHMSLGLIHIFNDPAWFGRIPDPPERECDPENYETENCRFCGNEAECRELWNEEGDENG